MVDFSIDHTESLKSYVIIANQISVLSFMIQSI